MLSELYIRDFAIITELRLPFGSGFNVLTGETGAGKSIILDAVTLILGGRADTAFVRAGSDRATVEATFTLNDACRQLLSPILQEHDLIDEDQSDILIAAREIRANGRNVCRINGSTVRVSILRQVGEIMVGIHGQGEHLALLHPKAHLPLLDAFARLTESQKALGNDVGRLRQLRRERESLMQDARTRAQRIDMLRFQIQEIEAASLQAGEEAELKQERARLGNVEQLMRHSATALATLSGMNDGETPGVSDLLSQTEAAVNALTRLDESKNEWLPRLQGLLSEFDDLANEIGGYQDGLEHDPQRLNEVEERLELIARLKKKYGDDISSILNTAANAQTELDRIENSDSRIEELSSEIDKSLKRIGRQAKLLSEKRKKAAKKLAKGVEAELKELKMQAQFEVDFATSPDSEGAYVGDERLAYDRTGIDQVEFLISANPGEPLKPMAKVASGGETARLMLALKTALARVDATPTLIFDEIDQGIGGRIGTVVGKKLWGLSSVGQHQVIVVTHLPQMAGFGDSHFHVSKHVSSGRTSTKVERLTVEQRIDELGAMLGTKPDLAKVGARSILKEAAAIKKESRS